MTTVFWRLNPATLHVVASSKRTAFDSVDAAKKWISTMKDFAKRYPDEVDFVVVGVV